LRAWLDTYRPHLGLIFFRSVAVGLFCMAGANVATAYLDNFLVAVLVGATIGIGVGLGSDRAAIAYGRRMGRLDAAEHRVRQAANRRAYDDRPVDQDLGGTVLGAAADRAGRHHLGDREAGARHNATLPGLSGAALAATTLAQATRGVTAGIQAAETGPGAIERYLAHRPPGAGPDLVVADAPAHPVLPLLDAVRRLRDMMLAELRPEDLVGQRGRGVIQLAAVLGPRVPELQPETVVDYITDHVLVAAGQAPERSEQWPGVLDGVAALTMPAGTPDVELTDAQLLGVNRFAGDPGPLLDAVVDRIAHGGGSLDIHQLGLALRCKGHPVGPHVLAGVAKFLVDQGQLSRPFGAWKYTLSDAERERREAAGGSAAAGARPPLGLVWTVLNAGPVEGLSLGDVATEVGRCSGMPCTLGGAAAALDALVSAGRAEAHDGMFVALGPAPVRPALATVWQVLADGPAGGMTANVVALEVNRLGGPQCTRDGAEEALRALVSAGRAAHVADASGRYTPRVHPTALSGPGLRERIKTAVVNAYPDADAGLTLAELTERVDADGFGAGEDRVRDMAAQLISQGALVMSGDRYQEAPF
jgi:hypothetical protein